MMRLRVHDELVHHRVVSSEALWSRSDGPARSPRPKFSLRRRQKQHRVPHGRQRSGGYTVPRTGFWLLRQPA
eukprot:3384225-Prymnesium_polylepis.1